MSLEKENERIEGMRARNVARTNRFLDARLRTIGLDTDALDEQMRQRRAREEGEKVRSYRGWHRTCTCISWRFADQMSPNRPAVIALGWVPRWVGGLCYDISKQNRTSRCDAMIMGVVAGETAPLLRRLTLSLLYRALFRVVFLFIFIAF